MDRADKAGEEGASALVEDEAETLEREMEEILLSDGTDVDVDVLMEMPLDLQQDVIAQMNRAQRIKNRESLLPIAGRCDTQD